MRLPEIGSRAGTGAILLLLLLTGARLAAGVVDPQVRPASAGSHNHLYVLISGDVRFPGVYRFHRPPSLKGLVDRAGGALRWDDEQRLPRVGPFGAGTRVDITAGHDGYGLCVSQMPGSYRVTLGIPIPINSEGAEGLASVPGISARIAKAIIRERDRRGGFRSMDDIQSVAGIGPVLYRKIRPCLTLARLNLSAPFSPPGPSSSPCPR